MEERTTLASGSEWIVYHAWDGNGNLAGKSEFGRVTLYRFDPRNRLIDIRSGASVALAQSAAPSISYAYDAQGNRVRKKAADERGYLIDPSYAFPQLAVETWSTGRSYYVRGLDIVSQTIEGGPLLVQLFPLQGHLGTSMGAVDASGEVVEAVDADAFGNLDQSAELRQGHVYAGEYWDQDAQLLYLRARWYDPKVGRFISADLFEGKQRDPRSLNRYAYAHGDPVHAIDPTGRFAIVASPIISTAINVGIRVGAGAATTGVMVRIAAQLVRSGVRASHLVKAFTRACATDVGINSTDCMGELPTFILGNDYQGHTNFVALAQAATSPGTLHRTPRLRGAWYINTPECQGRTGGSSGLDCDEYPYATSAEGGREGYDRGIVALEPVSIGDNRGAGGKLRAFYNNPKCPVPTGGGSNSRFQVEPLPGSPTTFWTCSR